MKNTIREEKKWWNPPKKIHSSMRVCYLFGYPLQLLGLYFICFDSFFWISRLHIIWFWSIFRSFQIKSYNQFKLMSRSTMGTCEGTSKSHIGQSVGRGGKFRNQIYASCNLKIPHKDKNKKGILGKSSLLCTLWENRITSLFFFILILMKIQSWRW